MDNLLLARLMTAGGLQALLSNLGTSSSASGSTKASGAGAADTGSCLGTLLAQDAQVQNLAIMQALSEEAKMILKAELERNASTNQQKPEASEQEMKPMAKMTRTKDSSLEQLQAEKTPTDHDTKKRRKEANVDAPKSPGGSVAKYLDKTGAKEDRTENKKETASKPPEAQQTFMKPRPKHRPVSLVQLVVLPQGTLEIFTRFTPKEQAQPLAEMAQPVTSEPEPAVKTPATFPPPPPYPPPGHQATQVPLPPLPPPSTPHPDTLKDVARQMLELKETFEQWHLLGIVFEGFCFWEYVAVAAFVLVNEATQERAQQTSAKIA